MKLTVSLLALVVLVAVCGYAQTPQQTTPPTPPPAPEQTLKAEVQVCTGITDRMPTGGGTSFGADVGALYCWCKITGAKTETTIKHVWSFNGKEMASVELPVKSVAWRTNSQKKILPAWTGNWEVKVVDAAGNTLGSVAFTVGAAAPAEAPKQ
ncbi:MAG TPA: DUF2914 domain-containing protein [Candidatus Acidoferrum sp.]|nr:DUF2914 domain-containing protein [Candidatus Acidoferrum sp.]